MATGDRRRQLGWWQRALDKSESAQTFDESVHSFLLECLDNVDSAQARSHFRLARASSAETSEIKRAIRQYSTLARKASVRLVRNGMAKGLIRESGRREAVGRGRANEIALGVRLVATQLRAVAVRPDDGAGANGRELPLGAHIANPTTEVSGGRAR